MSGNDKEYLELERRKVAALELQNEMLHKANMINYLRGLHFLASLHDSIPNDTITDFGNQLLKAMNNV